MFKNILNIKAVGTNIQNTNANIKLADTLMNGSHTAISQQFKKYAVNPSTGCCSPRSGIAV